mgnify:CR=1 FL=1
MQLDDEARLIRRIARAFSTPDVDVIGVAVSGGGDSMALLHLAAKTGKTIKAVTVDHGLRAGAAAEAAMVGQMCNELGVAHTILEWRDWDGHGNLQAAARQARYKLMTAWAKDSGVGGVLLGHNKDDIAETYLMRLSRKAGIDGLAMMDTAFEKDGVHWARPLCHVSRADLRDYLTRVDVAWADDPSNDDVDFDRVRVRQAMGQLAEIGLTADALHHASVAAKKARSALDYYTAVEARAHVQQDQGDLIMARHLPIPDDIARRLRSKALQWIGGLDYPPRQSSLQHLETGLALGDQATVAGCLVSIEGDNLRFARELNAVKMTATTIEAIWDKRWQMDGPHSAELQIRALGEGIRDCPDWRQMGHPRASIMAGPAIWRGNELISAPLAGLNDEWTVRIVADFHSYLNTH